MLPPSTDRDWEGPTPKEQQTKSKRDLDASPNSTEPYPCSHPMGRDAMPTCHIRSLETYDLIVLGGGKGGKTLAMEWAKTGRRVALVEHAYIGGSCIHVACIPTKTMVQSAKVAHLASISDLHGIHLTQQITSMFEVRSRKRNVVDLLTRRNRDAFQQAGVDLLYGTGKFVGPKTIQVDGFECSPRTIQAPVVVINTGTRPSIPEIPGLHLAKPLDSTSIQELDQLPQHLVILGAGYIGSEFAQIFRRLGSQVTLVDRNPTILPREEPEIRQAIAKLLVDEGIEIITNATVEQVSGTSGDAMAVDLRQGSENLSVQGSHLAVAMGRIPNTEGLNLESTGLSVDDRGFIPVDERLESRVPGIWAMGDVTGGLQFTHLSLDDYRIVSSNLRGQLRTTTGRIVPYTLFIDPELGRVGMTERAAVQKGYSVKTSTLAVDKIPRAVTMGQTNGIMKAVVDADTDQILGCSILAPQGGEVMAVVQTAMLGQMTAKQLSQNIFSHPTMSEALGDLFQM
jgi:pyruvate/2-oxoglutarate dehydrogenase complex dihydrolipoamide dehydrogenase (E3) component